MHSGFPQVFATRRKMFSDTVMAEGHLIDSDILTRIFDTVIACQSTYEVVDFRIGRSNDEVSRLKLTITSDSPNRLEQTIGDLMLLGCYRLKEDDAHLTPASKDKCVP